jgi:hypothetical protein
MSGCAGGGSRINVYQLTRLEGIRGMAGVCMVLIGLRISFRVWTIVRGEAHVESSLCLLSGDQAKSFRLDNRCLQPRIRAVAICQS